MVESGLYCNGSVAKKKLFVARVENMITSVAGGCQIDYPKFIQQGTEMRDGSDDQSAT